MVSTPRSVGRRFLVVIPTWAFMVRRSARQMNLPQLHRLVVEIVEEMLDHPSKGANLLTEIPRFALREGGGMERQLAVLDAGLPDAGEQST